MFVLLEQRLRLGRGVIRPQFAEGADASLHTLVGLCAVPLRFPPSAHWASLRCVFVDKPNFCPSLKLRRLLGPTVTVSPACSQVQKLLRKGVPEEARRPEEKDESAYPGYKHCSPGI